MKHSVSELDGKVYATSQRQPLRVFYKFMRALSPISYLARARDCYVGSMNKCAGLGMVAALGPTMAVPVFFTSNSSSLRDRDDDCRELMKAASQKKRATTTLSHHEPFPRSLSTPTDHSHLGQHIVGRIDEESPRYFSASFRKTADEDIFPRSHSCRTVQKMNLHARRNANAV